MSTWVEDIVIALTKLGGVASLSDIYQEVRQVRQPPHPEDLEATIRQVIQNNSSDSRRLNRSGRDLFFSGKGLRRGIWGLRSSLENPKAVDIDEITNDDDEVLNHNVDLGGNQSPGRERQETYRVLRDTKLARQIKLLNHHRCQLCETSILLADGKGYSEAHHIKPLGRPHNGPDTANNIIVLCPNHHVMLDYGVIKLNINHIHINDYHKISKEFIDYHNERIFGGSY